MKKAGGREAILTSALKLFAERDLDAVRTAEILAAAGQTDTALVGRLAAANQQDVVIPEDDDTHADERPIRIFSYVGHGDGQSAASSIFGLPRAASRIGGSTST